MIPLAAVLLLQAADLDRTLVDELGRLKASVLADLRDPEAARLPNGAPDPWKVIDALTWACGWTHPDFVPSLKVLLEKPGELRFRAALCLLHYKRPDLDARVMELGGSEYTRADGCVIWTFKISTAAEEFQKSRRLPDFMGRSDLDRSWTALRTGKPEEREAAWKHLGARGWFLPWKEFGLEANALWNGSDKCGPQSPFFRPRVGETRLLAFLAEIRDTAPKAYDRHQATARRWALGDGDEATACAKLLRFAAGGFEKPGFEGHAYLEDLARRPLADQRDAYRELTKSGSHDLQRLGWTALVNLDDPTTWEDLEVAWNQPEDDLGRSTQLLTISGLAFTPTSHRRRWIEWLIRLQPKVPRNERLYPEWINAVSHMAGVRFGVNGQMVPGGFDEPGARETTDAILKWAAAQPK